MTYLADVNVWLALAYVAHVHHATAQVWFRTAAEDRVLFCRITQMGLQRLLTNPRVMGEDVLTADGAWSAFDTLMQDDRIGYAAEPQGLDDQWRQQTRGQHSGPNFWTDAYLAAFAAATGWTIVSFDRQFARRKNVPVRLLG